MLRLRALLVWLLLAAIPLQGLAVSSMAHCSEDRQAHQTWWHAGSAESELVVPVAVGHAGHSHSHVDTHVVERASTGVFLDVGHKCGACASCCHAVALTSLVSAIDLLGASPGHPAESVVYVDSIPSQVPDKPPRA